MFNEEIIYAHVKKKYHLNTYGWPVMYCIIIRVSLAASYAQRKPKVENTLLPDDKLIRIWILIFSSFMIQICTVNIYFYLLDINGIPCPLRQPG